MNSLNVLEYKGYYTKVEYSVHDKVLFGKIEGINDLVNFEAENPDDVEREFHLAVDDYLAFCKDNGDEPDKPYKGVFNVRMSPELHKSASQTAFKNGMTLNAFVVNAVENAIDDRSQTTVFLPFTGDILKNYFVSETYERNGVVQYGR